MIKNEYVMGYLIEYTVRENFFDEYGETKKAICTQEMLGHILQLKPFYIVWNAHLINISEYKINHPEENLETLDLDK